MEVSREKSSINSNVKSLNNNATGCINKFCAWILTINDITRGEEKTIALNYNSSLSSGEIIDEAPTLVFGSNEAPLPLANFGIAYFGHAFTGINNTNFITTNNKSVPIGNLHNVYQFYIVPSPLNFLVSSAPTPLIESNTSFKVYSGISLLSLYIANPKAQNSSVSLSQSDLLTDSNATGGTGYYSYQWLEEAPGSNTFADAPSLCYSSSTTKYDFVTGPGCNATISGFYTFELRVTDNATLENFTSGPVSINVGTNPPANSVNSSSAPRYYIPLTVYNAQGSPLAAGTQFAVTFNALNYSSTGLNSNLSNICMAILPVLLLYS